MHCEIVTIGSELLLGQIVDTNASYLAETLNRAGVAVEYHTTVGDSQERIVEALDLALSRTHLVLATGGIGPTEDDLTRQAAAEVLGVPLVFRQDLMDHIEGFFRRARYTMAPNNRRQAYIPQGCLPIFNPVGTAPGFMGEKNGSLLVALPGVPRELKYLMEHTVIPYIKERFKLGQNIIHYRVLKAAGLGESNLDNQIGDLIRSHENPSIGLLASPGEIRIRITAHAESEHEADTLITPLEKEIRSRLGKLIYGQGDDTLEGVVSGLLTDEGMDLSVLETFTGGLIASRLNRIRCAGLREGRCFAKEESLKRWLGVFEPSSFEDRVLRAAGKLAVEARTQTCLAVVGFIEEEQDQQNLVHAFMAVTGPGIKRTARYDLGGEHSVIMERGAVIGLDLLRKALLKDDRGV
jgi:nicotinamide-nucleotide amidase